MITYFRENPLQFAFDIANKHESCSIVLIKKYSRLSGKFWSQHWAHSTQHSRKKAPRCWKSGACGYERAHERRRRGRSGGEKIVSERGKAPLCICGMDEGRINVLNVELFFNHFIFIHDDVVMMITFSLARSHFFYTYVQRGDSQKVKKETERNQAANPHSFVVSATPKYV